MGASGWTEILVLVPAGWEELVADALAHGPCSSVAYGRPSLGTDPPPDGFEYLRAYVPEGEDSPALRAELETRLGGLAESAGDEELAGIAPRFRRLPPEDYAESWKKVWKPFRVGRICVVPSGWDRAPRERDLRLTLDPRSSFGTGRHSTTRMCLRALQERMEPGTRVLDAGTGSGILAVAAALLGAERALGFDLDPESAAQASELAAKNGVAARCEFRRGGFEVLGADDVGFDALLANLYADLIQERAGELAERLRPGGWFAVSGCPLARRDDTRAALEAAGLAVEETRSRGRWWTFLGRRELR